MSAADADAGEKDRPPEDPWERAGREFLRFALLELRENVDVAAYRAADRLYWHGQPDAEHVEALRQAVFDVAYLTEECLAAACADTEPWPDDADREPSWVPDGPSDTGARETGSTDPD